jgi:plastocyanin
MRQAVWRRRNERLTWLAIVAGILSVPGVVLTSHSEALAAGTTITGYSGSPCATNCWQPAHITVNVGDQVTWALGSGPHGLEKLPSGSAWPPGCPADGTYGSCSFSQAGTYNFQCSVHKAAMMGSVAVSGPPPPIPSPQPPAPPPPPPVPPAGHQAPTAQSPPPAALPAPSQSQALPSPSPSPSDTSQALASPSGASSRSGGLAADTSRGMPRGGPGPLPFIIGLAVLVGLAGAVVYFVRTRKPANPAP